MTIDDAKVSMAYDRFCSVRAVNKLFANSIDDFANFLGLADGFYNYDGRKRQLPEAAARKVEWLCGPHAYTMYKIWEAQHEQCRE